MSSEKTLVIVESPTKAKTISRFLGKNYTIKSSMGHVRDLPKSQLGIDIENDFEPKYITIRGKGNIVKELKAARDQSSRVLLATDPDREGEAIAWHLQNLLKVDEQNCRIEFHEITKEAIQKAVQKPRGIKKELFDAQQARRVLDRLVGYSLSPLLWRKVKKGLSAGRVQSVALRLICDREEEIAEFKPEEYWSLTAYLLTLDGKGKISARLVQKNDEPIKIPDAAAMDEILLQLADQDYQVASVKRSERKRRPQAPFITSTLQQEAYRKLNFTARKTMRIAQELYEGVEVTRGKGAVGLITYMRTDSTAVASEAQQMAREYVAGEYGQQYLPGKPPVYASRKTAQEAHEAIRPTAVDREPEAIKGALSRDQYRLYRLIWARFVASQMAPAVMDTTVVNITAGEYTFRANGSILKFPGFLKVYDDGGDQDSTDSGILPEVNQGDLLQLKKLEPQQHFTQPPPRYSEASLVKTLEELGIGRPSTYAPTIETLLTRSYIVRENKQFYPTELGNIVIDLLKQYFAPILDIDFTANLEEELDKIEEGKLYWKDVIREFYFPFQELLEQADEAIGKIKVEDEVSDEICEICGRRMVIKIGRYGKFLACPGFPECRNTKPLLEQIGVNCRKCGAPLVRRRSKKGRTFYGCSNYPECDFVSWDKPTAETCPKCGSMLLEKSSRKKGTRLVCSGEGCGYEKKQARS